MPVRIHVAMKAATVLFSMASLYLFCNCSFTSVRISVRIPALECLMRRPYVFFGCFLWHLVFHMVCAYAAWMRRKGSSSSGFLMCHGPALSPNRIVGLLVVSSVSPVAAVHCVNHSCIVSLARGH